MKPLPLLALLAVATLAATPALAGPRHWQGRPGTPIGAYGYTPGYAVPYYRPGRAYGRAVPVYGGYYAPQRAFRPAFYPPVYAAPIYRPVVYGAPVVYGGYVQPVPVPVPVPVAYGGYGQPLPVAYGGYPVQGYYDPCRSTGTGAVLGAIAGGLIGNGIAGPYDRGLGTVVGAGLGAVTGTAIERSQRCGY